MSEQNSQDTGQQQAAGAKFDRGSALSIFQGDRREDFTALLFAMVIALGVYVMV
ncbi:MAG: hypothetical protein V3T80_11195 [Kiloniellales bacterium]